MSSKSKQSSSGASANASAAVGVKIEKKEPKSFTITSGEMLWGQYHCLAEGSQSSSRDGPYSKAPTREGGTVIQKDWQYRVATKKGKWQISKLRTDERDLGYIAYHEHTDPKEYAKLASDLGISGKDKKMLYINRYDWGYHHGDAKTFLELATVAADKSMPASKKRAAPASKDTKLGKRQKKDENSDEDEDEDEEEDSDAEEREMKLTSGCCVLLDASYFASVLEFFGKLKLESEFPPPESFSFVAADDEKNSMGVHLTDNDIEYELAWIGFSGEPHPDFPESQECVAFVYDTSYTGLEVNEGQKLYVDDQVAKSNPE